MRKLLLMFAILLGSVATIQAQTFDFSCAEVVAPGDIVEDGSSFTTTPTLAGFDSTDMTSLDDALFNERASDDGAPYFGIDVQPTAQIGRYEIRIQNFDGGISVGNGDVRYDYQLTNHINRGSRTHSNDGAELIALAIAAAGRDTDNDGYTDHENYLLWEASFVEDGGRFQFWVNQGQTTDSSIGYYAIIEIVAGEYEVYNDEDQFTPTQHNSLQDAIAHVRTLN